MMCKECQYFNKTGLCEKTRHDISLPFLITNSNKKCCFERTALRCKNCKHWAKAQGTKREDNTGGCTFERGYFPTFLGEPCILKDKYLKQVEKENGLDVTC